MNSMPAPSPLIVALVEVLVQLRRFMLRHLALPRSPRRSKHYIASGPSKLDSERYHALRYRGFPWYIAPVSSISLKARLKDQPPPGPLYRSDGYKILELGPDELQGKGELEMAQMARSIREARGAK